MKPTKNPRRPRLYPQKITDYLSIIVATYFGSGLLPKMPGTWGTIACLPLFWWMSGVSLLMKAIFLLLLLIGGTIASAEIQKMSNCGDHQSIVLDEVLGTGITLFLTAADPKWFLVGAILFRFFDIVKLPPVNWVDTWSKNKGKNPYFGGFGVMADDLIAGFQSLFILTVFQKWMQ